MRAKRRALRFPEGAAFSFVRRIYALQRKRGHEAELHGGEAEARYYAPERGRHDEGLRA